MPSTYEPKTRVDCGETFEPTSGNQKYCPRCQWKYENPRLPVLPRSPISRRRLRRPTRYRPTTGTRRLGGRR